MPDPYSTINEAPDGVQQAIASAMEARSLEPAQIRMRRQYLGDVDLPNGAMAADLGAGTGHLARDLVEIFGCRDVLGIDYSPVMVSRATELHREVPGLTFRQGDARDTKLPDASLDLVVLHTVLCHVPGPEAAVAEAFRILKPGGAIAIFDGDYDTTTAAIFENDPLDAVVQWFVRSHVHDIWLTRRLVHLVTGAGFVPGKMEGHAYLAEGDAPYFRTIVGRGSDLMAQAGLLTPESAKSIQQETDQRIRNGSFFGSISFLSLLATKPKG